VFQLGDLVLGVRNALVDGLNGESINDIELILPRWVELLRGVIERDPLTTSGVSQLIPKSRL
jgi:hypothetical protein